MDYIKRTDMTGFNKRGSNYDVERHLEENPEWKPPVEFFQFCGEKILRETYEEAEFWDIKGYFAGLFCTGARASEFLELNCNHCGCSTIHEPYPRVKHPWSL